MLRYRRKIPSKFDLPSTAKNLPSCCVTAVKIPSKFDLPSTAKNLPSKNEKQSTPKKLPSCCVTVPSESVKNIVTEHLFSSFSSRSYPPVRKRTDHCGMNMSTNIALKTRTRCFSFDQYVRKCNDSLVVNMMVKKSLYFRTEWYLLCYCCCVKHPAHRNSKSRVYPLRCQDSRPCLLYTSPSPRDRQKSRMPSSA